MVGGAVAQGGRHQSGGGHSAGARPAGSANGLRTAAWYLPVVARDRALGWALGQRQPRDRVGSPARRRSRRAVCRGHRRTDFRRLPLAVLAATLVVLTVPRLIDVSGFLKLWRGWRPEAFIALVTAACLVAFGVLHGVLNEVDEHQLPQTDVLIYRVDAPLFFANVGRVGDRIRTVTATCQPDLRYLILDAEAVFYLDASAADAMAEFTLDMRGRGCELLLARVRKPVLTTLQTNPYRDGATRDLHALPSVRHAYTYAREKLEGRYQEGVL
jgi:hypothetical protein